VNRWRIIGLILAALLSGALLYKSYKRL